MLGPEWKYHITIDRSDWARAVKWCEVNVGEFGHDWYKLGNDPAEYVVNGSVRTTWYFKREQDIILFKLRWA